MLEGKRPSPSSDLLVASLDEWAIEADRRDGVIARAREMWQYRRVLWFFASRSLKSLYSKTRLGPTWLLIRTLVPLIVGSAVFGGVMKVSTGSVPYFIFLNVSQIPWNCFDGPLVRASRGLDANRQLLTKLYLPRMILPIGQ